MTTVTPTLAVGFMTGVEKPLPKRSRRRHSLKSTRTPRNRLSRVRSPVKPGLAPIGDVNIHSGGGGSPWTQRLVFGMIMTRALCGRRRSVRRTRRKRGDCFATDGLADHLAPYHVPSADRGRRTGDRHEAIHVVRKHLAPKPGLHAAHRCPEHQLQAPYAYLLKKQMLRPNLIPIAVMREMGVRPMVCLSPQRRSRPGLQENIG
jgi:hypothetical protein